MKKYKILLISLIICFICTLTIGLTACSGDTGETGAQGEQGIQGEKGDKGATGDDGDDGLSAYELYVETYGYTGTLSEWLEDLANGNLATVSYTVTFNSEGAGDIASQTVKRGDKVTEPETPTLAGHTFLGWYCGEEKWSFIGYAVTENITLSAKWSVTNTDVTYTLNTQTETYEVTAYSGTDEVIDLLPTVDGVAVTGIADSVFKGNSHIKSVTIHEGVTSIGESAFNSCSNLESITLPASLTTIGSTAFTDSANLASVYYAGTATQWASITFGSGSSSPMYNGAALYLNGDTDTSVTSLTFESSLTAINSSAFYGCTSITSVTIPAGVTSIGGYAFKECANLATVEFAEGSQLETIGTETFYGCTSLTNIAVPAGVKEIGSSAFSGCSSLVSMTLPFVGGSADATVTSASTVLGYIFGTASYNGSTLAKQYYSNGNYAEYYIPTTLTTVTITGGNILYGAFYNCSNLTSITLPDNLTSVGIWALTGTAFYNNDSNWTDNGLYVNTYLLKAKSSTSFTIKDGTTVIANSAFESNSTITTITIPASVTSIGTYAFSGCTALASVYYTGTATQWASISFANASANPINNTSTTTNLYFNNVLVENITLENITAINNYAFYNCTSLTSVTIGSSVTTIGTWAFRGCSALTSVTFESTSGWYVTQTSGETSGTDVTVTDTSANATNLKTTYYTYYWYRSVSES